jgi:hypothetical protein
MDPTLLIDNSRYFLLDLIDLMIKTGNTQYPASDFVILGTVTVFNIAAMARQCWNLGCFEQHELESVDHL